MTGHRVRAKKEMDMENQSKLGKYLVEKTIKEISTRSTPQLFLDNMLILMTILLLYSISGVLFFFGRIIPSFFESQQPHHSQPFQIFNHFNLPFFYSCLSLSFFSHFNQQSKHNVDNFSLNANFHQSIFSRCRVNSWFVRLRAGMVYVVKRTNKGLCKIRLKGVDYGNTPCNDGVIIRTAGKVFWL